MVPCSCFCGLRSRCSPRGTPACSRFPRRRPPQRCLSIWCQNISSRVLSRRSPPPAARWLSCCSFRSTSFSSRGSSRVGRIVMRAAAENLTPVLLELGGQNPAVVDKTANLRDAAKKITWGATAWGGQWCTSPGYAYVHESIADAFLAEAKKALVELYGHDPKSNPDYSRIISTKEAARLAALIDPTKVVYGGKSDPDARYVDPTILYPVAWDDEIMRDEIFGPILPILTYQTLDEALGTIAATPHPLAAFIFSRDKAAIDRFIGELSFGGGAVNQVNINLFIETMPFGGVGPSGMGHYYGKYGFDMLTHAKSMLISPPDVAIKHLFPPFSPEKNADLKIWSEY